MQLENRNLVKCILLSIVTCGIYGIIWIVKAVGEAVKVKDTSDSAVLEIVLALFLPFLGFFLAEKKFAEGCQARDIPHSDNSIIYLILGIFGLSIVSLCLMQNELNKIADTNITF